MLGAAQFAEPRQTQLRPAHGGCCPLSPNPSHVSSVGQEASPPSEMLCCYTRFISSISSSLVLSQPKLHGLTPELRCTNGAAHFLVGYTSKTFYKISTVLCDHSQLQANYFSPASLTLNTIKGKNSLKNKSSIFLGWKNNQGNSYQL